MTIIGRRDLIPHLVHRKSKARKARRQGAHDPKVFEKYDRRARVLQKLGYRSYREYLASDDWKAIRSRVLATAKGCLLCDRPAAVVHHVKYSEPVLLGLDDARLAPLCHQCHESLEIDADGHKTRMSTANTGLFTRARSTERGRAWLAVWFGECRERKKKRKAQDR
jgi:hypothetical protein